MPVNVSIFFNYPLSAIINFSIAFPISDTELLEWRVEWESGEVSHFHKNIFKTDIADLKKQIREFADNWVDKLDDLETKQKKELERIKRQNEKVSLFEGLTKAAFTRDRIRLEPVRNLYG